MEENVSMRSVCATDNLKHCFAAIDAGWIRVDFVMGHSPKLYSKRYGEPLCYSKEQCLEGLEVWLRDVCDVWALLTFRDLLSESETCGCPHGYKKGFCPVCGG